MIILFIFILLSFLGWRERVQTEQLAKEIADEINRQAKEEQNQYNLTIATRRGDDTALAIRLKNSPHMLKPLKYSSYPDDSPAYLENDPNSSFYEGVKKNEK